MSFNSLTIAQWHECAGLGNGFAEEAGKSQIFAGMNGGKGVPQSSTLDGRALFGADRPRSQWKRMGVCGPHRRRRAAQRNYESQLPAARTMSTDTTPPIGVSLPTTLISSSPGLSDARFHTHFQIDFS